MIALPVIEIVKFHINPAQGPDIISNVPFIEVEVQLALKEAISDPETISESRVLPATAPERVPVEIHSEPVMDTVPLTKVLV